MHQIRPGVFVDDPWPGAHRVQVHVDQRGVLHVTGEKLNGLFVYINGKRFVPDLTSNAEMEQGQSREKPKDS